MHIKYLLAQRSEFIAPRQLEVYPSVWMNAPISAIVKTRYTQFNMKVCLYYILFKIVHQILFKCKFKHMYLNF